MRFEIKAGGGFLILVGLVGLSGAVFALGLVAGYEMARQTQPDINQISSTYPLPNPPEKPEPISAMSPANNPAAAPSIAEAPASPAAPAEASTPAHVIAEAPPPKPRPAAPSPAAIARLKPPPAPAINSPPAEDTDEDSDETASSAPAAPPAPAPVRLPPGARPYNIQIEAVMDKSGADEMVSRLRALGYNAQETTVTLDEQTWYRVRVGPYASADEATAAQNRLREQYRQAYTTSH